TRSLLKLVRLPSQRSGGWEKAFATGLRCFAVEKEQTTVATAEGGDRMRARIPVLLLIVILTISGCGTRNQSPTLLRFTASSERLYVGDVVELKVEAVDPENQP